MKADLPRVEEIEESLRAALSSGQVTNFGPFVQEFESRLSEFLGVEVLTLSSGTLGLLLTLEALVGTRGQKVAVPSFTFVATVQAIVHAGGIPLFVDIAEDATMSVEDLRAVVSNYPDVRAVVPVHTYGLPCRVDEIESVAEEYSDRIGTPVPVLYDAAHAFGSAVDGRRVGGFGRAEVFSLSVTKTLVSIEGGLVATKDRRLIEKLRQMRNYGIGSNYEAVWPGLNGKMSELHAIVGLANLKRMDEILETRARIAKDYTASIHEATSCRAIPVPDNVRHTFKDFTVLVPEDMRSIRDQICDHLSTRGIGNRRYFDPPVHRHRMFSRFAGRQLPKTDDFASRVITIPFYTSMSAEDVEKVVGALAEAEKAASR